MFHSRDRKCCEAFICFIIFVVVFLQFAIILLPLMLQEIFWPTSNVVGYLHGKTAHERISTMIVKQTHA